MKNIAMILGSATTLLVACGWTASTRAETLAVDFEDIALAPNSHDDGYDAHPYPTDNEGEEHPFISRGTSLYNYHIDGWTSDWGGYTYTYWEGWSISSHTDATTPGYGNQYSAIAGGGVAGSSNYAVGYLPETPNPAADAFRRVDVGLALGDDSGQYGFYATNTTYTYFTMRDGDSFSRKFGHTRDTQNQTWIDTNEPDWFKLIITGLDAGNAPIAGLDPVEFYLADFRNLDGSPDYIVDDWTWVDLSSLVVGGAEQLHFRLDSSDQGDYGINTPLYVAIDAVPEPSSLLLILTAGLFGLFHWRRKR